MKFVHQADTEKELTFEDVFLFQQYFDGVSRFRDTDVVPSGNLGMHIPIVSANMNAVTGKRMAETIARFGGLGVLPQDMELATIERILGKIKKAHIKYDTPMTVTRQENVRDALGIIHKRSHGCVILVDEENKPLSIFTLKDLAEFDQFTHLGDIKKSFLITGNQQTTDEEAFDIMHEHAISSLPIINQDGVLIGIVTKKNSVRYSIYKPTLNAQNELNVAVALGVNTYEAKLKRLVELGVNIFVLDTAHGFQKKMIEAVQFARKTYGDKIILIAGNVCTKEGTKALIEAGANGVKVGIGPGAMCTTRMQTGVGRPQFTAVLECTTQAKAMGGFVWADGGIRNPRDMVLALAAGAQSVMIGSLFSGTYESTGDAKVDGNGDMFKENYGMASGHAVKLRTQNLSPFEQAKSSLYQEGISSGLIYFKKGKESVGDLVDEFIAGLRSAMTYTGARNLEEFAQKALIGSQTQAGFTEGTPHGRLVK